MNVNNNNTVSQAVYTKPAETNFGGADVSIMPVPRPKPQLPIFPNPLPFNPIAQQMKMFKEMMAMMRDMMKTFTDTIAQLVGALKPGASQGETPGATKPETQAPELSPGDMLKQIISQLIDSITGKGSDNVLYKTTLSDSSAPTAGGESKKSGGLLGDIFGSIGKWGKQLFGGFNLGKDSEANSLGGSSEKKPGFLGNLLNSASDWFTKLFAK